MEKPQIRALGLATLLFLVVIPNYVLQRENKMGAKAVKSSDQYWRETGLSSKELEPLLSNANCFSDQRKLLACVNSVNSMAERYNLILDTSGALRPITEVDIATSATEKSEMSKWEKLLVGPELSVGFSFLEKWKALEKRYVQNSERSAVIAAGINGYLSIVKDPHTYLLPIAQYEEVISNSEAKQDKVGFIFRRAQNRLVIKKVFEGSPADLAGLRKSDEIVKINGRKTDSLLMNQISEMLKFRDGLRLSLVVQRRGEEKYFEILRSDRVYPSVTARVIPGKAKLGLLMIHKFSKDTCLLAKSKLIAMMEEGVRGLMVDVRDNPGGQLDEAACIINLFVKKNTLLFQTRYLDASKSGEEYKSSEEPVYSGPVAVLINSGSASAFEILAGSLKDLGRATLVGERTFGKGSFQDGRVWGANKKVAIFETQGLYYFPSGWTPQMVGLEPDIPIAFNNSEQREEELYFNPIKPKDKWTGPQTLAWLHRFDCDSSSMLEGLGSSGGSNPFITEDLQIKEASNLLLCRTRTGEGARGEDKQ